MGQLARLPLPRPTIRLRLTLVYGGLFLVSGAVLLTVTYVLVSHSTSGTVFAATDAGGGGIVSSGQSGAVSVITAAPPGAVPPTGFSAGEPDPQLHTLAAQLTAVAAQQRSDQLHQLLIQSGIALAGMAVVSIGLGWLVAGRVLRPLRTMTTTARSISASNLHRRLRLDGPNDELTELGGTFNGLLGRLERAFQAQRQFIANASHELRSPLARQRTIAEVALRDPRPTVESLRSAHERVVAAGEQQERLIEALLLLARSERGLEQREPFDLAEVAGDVIASRRSDVQRQGLTLHTTLDGAIAWGDVRLAERVVANLVDNAVRYNVPGGRVDVATRTTNGIATLHVSNTGPAVAPDEVPRLVEPFRRAGTQRVQSNGLGLGLSIVEAIAVAHDGSLELAARDSGGLDVSVTFASTRA